MEIYICVHTNLAQTLRGLADAESLKGAKLQENLNFNEFLPDFCVLLKFINFAIYFTFSAKFLKNLT